MASTNFEGKQKQSQRAVLCAAGGRVWEGAMLHANLAQPLLSSTNWEPNGVPRGHQQYQSCCHGHASGRGAELATPMRCGLVAHGGVALPIWEWQAPLQVWFETQRITLLVLPWGDFPAWKIGVFQEQCYSFQKDAAWDHCSKTFTAFWEVEDMILCYCNRILIQRWKDE